MHQVADTVRNSLNFYRMQDAAETVDRAVLTGPAVAIPGFAAALAEQLQHAGRAGRSSRPRGRRGPRPPDRRGGPRGRRHAVAPRRAIMLLVTTGAGAAIAGVLGLLLGSFLNVVAYRLPRGESLVTPASHCPGCDTPDQAATTTCPVLSWLLLRGRCRSCGTSIAWRYPLVELATALLMALSCSSSARARTSGSGSPSCSCSCRSTVIDLDFRIIPNKLMLAGDDRRLGDPRC